MANEGNRAGSGQPLISVIIPVYRVEQYLDRCLQSVTDQDYTNFEALLVDDGSPDRSGEICEAWTRKDPRFRVFHKENGGLSDARNYGLDRCGGEYVSFIDSDDYVNPGYLSYLYGLICSADRCRISQANLSVIRGRRKEKADGAGEDAVLTRHEAAEAVLFHDRVDVTACSKLYHRSVFEDLRFPKGRLFEDTYVFADVLMKTENYAYGHIPQYNYVKNEDSITAGAFREKNLEYIESAERLAHKIGELYPDLAAGCVRRVNHARLSVLRQMKDCGEAFLPVREDLRKKVLAEAGEYIRLPKTPRRDKLAVMLLRMGWVPFYSGWDLYTRVRNG